MSASKKVDSTSPSKVNLEYLNEIQNYMDKEDWEYSRENCEGKISISVEMWNGTLNLCSDGTWDLIQM